MIKRILLACAAIVLCVVLTAGLSFERPRFYQTLEVNVSVNGETLDLQGTSVKHSFVLAKSEPPMMHEIYSVLGYYDGIFRTEYVTEEYWHYYYDFMLPSELTGFSENITVHVGEFDAIAWEKSLMKVELDLEFTDSTEADAVISVTRIYKDKGVDVTESNTAEKHITENDREIENILEGHWLENLMSN